MRIPLILSLASGQLVSSKESDTPITTVTAKRGAGSEVLLELYETIFPGAPAEIEIRLVAKESGKYDGDIAAEATEWVFDGSLQGYLAKISWLTELIDALFAVDENPDNDKATVELMLELAWRANATDLWSRSQTVKLVLQNNVFRGAESSPPLSLDESWEWLKTRLVAGENVTLDIDDLNKLITISSESPGLGGYTLAEGAPGQINVTLGETSLGYLQIYDFPPAP